MIRPVCGLISPISARNFCNLHTLKFFVDECINCLESSLVGGKLLYYAIANWEFIETLR